MGVGMGGRPTRACYTGASSHFYPFLVALRIPPMVITTCVPTKTAHPPGRCYMLTTEPQALLVLMDVHHPASPTPVATPSSIRTAGPPPLTTAQSLHPLALLLQAAPIQPASCRTRTMRSSTPTPFRGQLGILPTVSATPRPHPLAWRGPPMKHMTLLASMPPPLGSPTPLNTQTMASGSSSACRLTCRGCVWLGYLCGAEEMMASQLFPDIQGLCSLLLSWTQPFSSWPSHIRSGSPSNTPSQGWCSVHAPVSRACPLLSFRMVSLLTFVLPDPSMRKGEGRLGEGRRGEEKGEKSTFYHFLSVLLP